jgi:hypothetical protein
VIDRSDTRTVLVSWLATVGAGAAWAGQLVVGYLVEDAACADGTRHWGLDARLLEGVVSLAALAGAAVAVVAAHWLTREARDGDSRGRLQFLGFWGLTGGVFFLALIVLTGIGIVALSPCRIG